MYVQCKEDICVLRKLGAPEKDGTQLHLYLHLVYSSASKPKFF